MAKKIKVFTSNDCPPCHALKKRLLAQGNTADGFEVEFVDIMTDEGFEQFEKEVLSAGDGAVPWVSYEGQRCQVLHDKSGVHFRCPNISPPSDSSE